MICVLKKCILKTRHIYMCIYIYVCVYIYIYIYYMGEIDICHIFKKTARLVTGNSHFWQEWPNKASWAQQQISWALDVSGMTMALQEEFTSTLTGTWLI
jgi:hypothetical protein